MKSDSTSEAPAWYVLRTKSLQEDRAAANLTAWGVETFSPKLPPKRNRLFEPLFPRYLFVRFDPSRMLHKVRFTRGVLYVVSFGGVPAVVTEEVITMIRCRAQQEERERLDSFQPGDRVLVMAGPLQNLIGVFEKDLPSQKRIQILLTTVAYTARVKLPEHSVTKLSLGNKNALSA